MPPKAAPASASASASKPTGTWDNVEFLNNLLVAFYQVGCHTNNFNPQVNAAIVEFLTTQEPVFHSTNKMVSSRLLMKWSPKVHEDILTSIFYNLAFSAEDWTKVMTDLKEMGYTFTESALR
ncbi:hypothetical protein V8C37DRAFT_401067 [Trichoderma ceciliae]